METKELIFVYNANSGKLNAMIDIAHKILMPSTYSCDLCKLTHGHFSGNKIWKKFQNENPQWSFHFYHKDEYEKSFGKLDNYPCVLAKDPSIHIILNATELGKIANTQSLMEVLINKLKS